MNTKRTFLLLIFGILSLAFLLSRFWSPKPGLAQASGTRAYLPFLQGGSAPSNLPPPDEASRRITVPAGFAIRIFAQNLTDPRLMTVGPDNFVYVALRGAGQIARLPDRNNNGLADGVEIVASGLNGPHNVEWLNGWMYVGENDRVERLADQNKDGVYETRQVVVSGLPTGGSHTTRTMHFGPDGKMYVAVGSSCNQCVETDPRRATILRFNADGSIPSDNPYANDADTRKRAVWASGLRNVVDFLWTPGGALWADMMGVDGLGDAAPPEVIVTNVQRGKWYGWPYCYNPKLGLNQPPQPLVQDTRLTMPAGVTCAQATPALITDLAHSAPIGITSASKSNFPADYRDDLFVGYHGSWDTSIPADYRDCKVDRVVVQNGAIVRTETFARGWAAAGSKCGQTSSWGRPAGVVFGADGALYISDDKSGRVYRVVYTGR